MKHYASRDVSRLVQEALSEDHAYRDITSHVLFDPRDRASGYVIFKGEWAVLCGLQFAQEAFRALSRSARIQLWRRDGDKIRRGARVLGVQGPAAALLAAERTALNFLCHLSGIATQTAYFLEKRGKRASCEISDTRKTHPGLRLAEKYAVAVGGGSPHRPDLASMAMIKDNHLRIFRKIHGSGWAQALSSKIHALQRRGLQVEVEAQSLTELEALLAARPNWIMLDNMKGAILGRAARRIRAAFPGAKIEVSGGVRLKDVSRLAALPIDRISSGAIIHSAPFADFSLELN